MKRPWTAKELAYLRQHHNTVDLAEIAAKLGRSLWSVWSVVRRQGLRGDGERITPATIRGIVILWEKGLRNVEIAAKLGCSVFRVRVYLSRMGLRQDPLLTRAARQKGHKQQAAQNGLKTIGHMQSLVQRQRALMAGWPDAINMHEVRILEALWKTEMSLESLCLVLQTGRRATRCRAARMVQRGLLIRRRVKRCSFFSLSPDLRKGGPS